MHRLKIYVSDVVRSVVSDFGGSLSPFFFSRRPRHTQALPFPGAGQALDLGLGSHSGLEQVATHEKPDPTAEQDGARHKKRDGHPPTLADQSGQDRG